MIIGSPWRPKADAGPRPARILGSWLLPWLFVACVPPDPPIGGSGGAGGGGAAGGNGGATVVCDAPRVVFQPTCASNICHAAAAPFPPNLEDDPTSRLVGKPSGSDLPCFGMPLIDAANPTASVLLTRLTGATCGERMPSNFDIPTPARPALTAEQLACVTSWVFSKKK